jgi:hypothetical protein
MRHRTIRGSRPGQDVRAGGAQLAHEAFALVELDEEGGDEGHAQVGLGTRPGAAGRALGEVGPGKVGDEGTILLDDGVRCHPGGKRGVSLSEWAGEVEPRRSR